MKTIAVLTSGREVAGMNATIRAIVRRGIFKAAEIYGVRSGFEGLINGDLVPMSIGTVGDIIHRGGTILQSSLSDSMLTDDMMQNALDRLFDTGIEGLVVIGDNGSLKAASQLSRKGFPIIGIPASAENDIAGTDYSIGFDTAVNTAVEAIDRIRDTASSHERTYVIEVLGQSSAQIALLAGLCVGAESILMPGSDSDMEDIIQRIEQGYKRGKTHSIIIVSEGFSQKNEVANIIQERTGFETKFTSLGHLQRGGSPSAYDRMIGSQMGAMSVDLLLELEKGLMIGMKKRELTVASFEQAAVTSESRDMSIYRLARSLSI